MSAMLRSFKMAQHVVCAVLNIKTFTLLITNVPGRREEGLWGAEGRRQAKLNFVSERLGSGESTYL